MAQLLDRPDETDSELTTRLGEQQSDATASTAFRLARLLYGGVAAFMAVDNFMNHEERVGYAESKGAPAPRLSVPAISASLLGGGIGILLWRAPKYAALGAAAFFASVTPVMHDFWNLEGEERIQEQLHFLKNTAMLGAALAFLTCSDDD